MCAFPCFGRTGLLFRGPACAVRLQAESCESRASLRSLSELEVACSEVGIEPEREQLQVQASGVHDESLLLPLWLGAGVLAWESGHAGWATGAQEQGQRGSKLQATQPHFTSQHPTTPHNTPQHPPTSPHTHTQEHTVSTTSTKTNSSISLTNAVAKATRPSLRGLGLVFIPFLTICQAVRWPGTCGIPR